MAIPNSGDEISFMDILAHFKNAQYPPHTLADFYGAESDSWQDPDDPTDYSTAESPAGVDSLTGRILVLHEPNGSSYQGDLQLVGLTLFQNPAPDIVFDWEHDTEGWSTFGYGSGTANAVAQGFQNGLVESIYSPIVTGTGTGIWNRDTGNTPSSGTGVTLSGEYCIYTETSSYRAVFSAVSPEITLSQTNITVFGTSAGVGSNIGEVSYYWVPNTAASGSMTDKVLIHSTSGQHSAETFYTTFSAYTA